MGIAQDISADWHAALAALAWQVDLGLTDISAESPLNRYDLPEPIKAPAPAPIIAAAKVTLPPPEPEAPSPEAALEAARHAAAQSQNLEALRQALIAYDHCDLKRGARNLVFADGNPKARVLILGEAQSIDDDREGRPFAGQAGHMLDRMFAAIGLSRTAPDPATALYLTNVMPWWPSQNREPSPEEIAMMRPFVERHIALINPDVIVLMGNAPLQTILNTKGILRARGTWGHALGKPVLPMTHPDHLLRNPAAKRDAWADLLSLQAKLRD